MEKKRPYEKLKFYQDICEIRKYIQKITGRFAKTNFRLVSQMRDASRSAKQNIREGYRKGTLGEFLHSIKISQGSLEELSGDIEDCLEDKLITQEEFDKFSKLYLSASYLSTQYLKAMSLDKNAETWNTPGKCLKIKKQPKGTSSNIRNLK
jgi:four helix bundle protein